MSKRTQLWIALGALGVVIILLTILFAAVVLGSKEEGQSLAAVAPPATWQPESEAPPPDPWADREDRAQQMVWERTAHSVSDATNRMTIRQAVETDYLQRAFPNLQWDRIQRVGWRAFQQEGSVYEVQFVLQDVGVELGPSWIVQTDPSGLQPPGSGGVVPANEFAQAVEHGIPASLTRYLGRESEVVEALTDHHFEQGARLASAILVYFKSRRQSQHEQIVGWTVYPERIEPGNVTLYRAFFQWQEDDGPHFAHWEVNLDTHQFRGLNLMASEIMAVGDTIDTDELENIRPRMLDETTPTAHQRRAFQALHTIVDNDRLIEAVSSLLWHESRHGTQIEYSRWNARPVPDTDGVYEVDYEYLENSEPRTITWRVDVDANRVEATQDLSRLAYVALNYGARFPTEAAQ
jgi:hypothetical protein